MSQTQPPGRPSRRRRHRDTSGPPNGRQQPYAKAANSLPVNDNVDIPFIEEEAPDPDYDPYRELTYVELGEPFRDPPTNAAGRHWQRMFCECVAGAIAHFEMRIAAAERELDRRDREIRRARLKLIEGGKS
jgi:hypothetical protein